MKSISQNNTRYLSHELKTRIHVVETYRNGNERFCSFLTCYSLEDLRIQGKQYLKRPNNISMQVLNFLTPIKMRNKLLNS